LVFYLGPFFLSAVLQYYTLVELMKIFVEKKKVLGSIFPIRSISTLYLGATCENICCKKTF
jgi:hypothetical protein